MGISIRTSVFPLRISLRKKEAWELIIELENEDSAEKMVSVEVELPMEATFGTVGISRKKAEKRFERFGPGQKETLKLPVNPSRTAMDGNYFGKVKVCEHYNDFEHVQRSFAKEIPFRIVA